MTWLRHACIVCSLVPSARWAVRRDLGHPSAVSEHTRFMQAPHRAWHAVLAGPRAQAPQPQAHLHALPLGQQKGRVRTATGLCGLHGARDLTLSLGEHLAQQSSPCQRLDSVALLPQRSRRRREPPPVLIGAQRGLRLVRLPGRAGAGS